MSRSRLAVVTAVVLAIVAIAAVAILRTSRERQAAARTAISRDQQLVASLASIRGAIAEFHTKNGRYPASLEQLVPECLDRIPVDPMTGSATGWNLTVEETVVPSGDFTTAATSGNSIAVLDVHSSANGSDPSGRRWSDY